MKKRFIEVSFPVKEVSEESAKEKNIRHGHISTLHIWWARRPLASSRATSYASLIPAPENDLEWDKKRQFIIELSKWENSLNPVLIEKARKEILEANGGKPLRVLDPFAGGGSIPLECLRLGLETYAGEYNPVAVLILKCTLEYPQKYGKRANSQKAIANSQKAIANKKGGEDENRVISGLGSLAEGYEKGRDLCFDKPDSQSNSLCSSEHSRRVGMEHDKGVHSVSENSERLFVRSRNSPDSIKELELYKQSNFRDNVTEVPGDKQNAQCFDKQLEQGQVTLLPNGYSLLADVKKWGAWVLEEAKREIGRFYPPDPDGSIPVGYIWARTIPCQNPSCNAEIPLMRQFWLAKKQGSGNRNQGIGKRIALMPLVNKEKKSIEFVIVQQGNSGQWKVINSLTANPQSLIPNFEPEKGTISRAIAQCLVCGSTVDDKTTRKLFQEGKAEQRMVAVVLHHARRRGKTYRLATERDLEVFREAEKYLDEKRKKLMEEWGMDPVPDEPTPEGKGRGAERAFSVRNYGLDTYGDLFNSRQKLALITFVEKVRQAYAGMIEEMGNSQLGMVNEKTKSPNFQYTIPNPLDYAKAVVSYLGLVPSRLADTNSTLCHWDGTWEKISTTFARQALPMNWDYIETNVFSAKGYSYQNILENNILKVLSHLSQIPPVEVEK